jgi:hypothetical protein
MTDRHEPQKCSICGVIYTDPTQATCQGDPANLGLLPLEAKRFAKCVLGDADRRETPTHVATCESNGHLFGREGKCIMCGASRVST